MFRRDINPILLQIPLDHLVQHCGLIRSHDERLIHEVLRTDRCPRGQPVVTRHQHNELLLINDSIFEIEPGFSAQKREVEPAAGKRLGKVWRIIT